MAVPTLTPKQQTSIIVLPVTGTHYDTSEAWGSIAGLPYGIYTGSADFCSGAVDQVAFTYKMLGGDVLDIELSASNVYASYELATLEYSYIVNNHQAKNVLGDFLGATTGTFDHDGELKAGELSSSLSGTQASLKMPKFTFSYSKRISDGLASAAAIGDERVYSASIDLVNNVQDYDLQAIVQSASIDGSSDGAPFTGSVNNKRIEIRRVYFKSPQAMWRFYGYYGGLNVVGNLFTYGQYSDESTFEIVPAWQNKLQSMAFEDNLYTRASHYSYEIRDNRISLYPPPSSPGTGSPRKVWFQFTIPTDAFDTDATRKDGTDGVNNYNTLPFANIPYENINSMGKQWIRKYALALSKEMLAQVRGKFGQVPIPGNAVTLNASELAAQAKDEQAALKEELKTLLDELTYQKLVEKDANMAENAQKVQVSVPMSIYVG
jgi:hypothetical protein